LIAGDKNVFTLKSRANPAPFGTRIITQRRKESQKTKSKILAPLHLGVSTLLAFHFYPGI